MEEKFNKMYQKVLEQLNETFNPELFDVGDLNAIHKEVGDLENPKFTFKRYNYQGQRLYIKLPLSQYPDGTVEVGNEVLDWGVGVTGVISKNERGEDKQGLHKWITDMRVKGVDVEAYLKERADFGTIFHLLADYLLKGTVYKKKGFKEQVAKIVVKEQLLTAYRTAEILDKYDKHLYNALIGFSNWCIEVDLKPIATELVVHGRNYAVASPIDILAEITDKGKVKASVPSGEVYKRDCKTGKKGDPKMVERTFIIPKRKTVIVDLKTSVNSYNSHMYQLLFCKDMLRETYNVEVEEVINWHPTKDMSVEGVVKKWNPSDYDLEFFAMMKRSCMVSLTKKFEKGIKLTDPDITQSEISLSGTNSVEEELDYRIEGNTLIMADGFEVNLTEL